MDAVYFGLELNKKAPELFGCLCIEPSGDWVTLVDVLAAMEQGETVTIRAASPSEMRRAEEVVALFEVGKKLGDKIGAVLDQQPSKEVIGATTQIRDAMETALEGYMIPMDILDKTKG